MKLYDKMVKENGDGCINDKESQSEHMGDEGCLTEVGKDDMEKRCWGG